MFYKATGNYNKETNNKYNTILIFTEDCTIQTFITLNVHTTIADKNDPNNTYTFDFIQPPGIYVVPAGSEGWILKSYFNLPNC